MKKTRSPVKTKPSLPTFLAPLLVLSLIAAACTGGSGEDGSTSTAGGTSTTDSEVGEDPDSSLRDFGEFSAPEWEPATRDEEILDRIDEETGPTAQDVVDLLGLLDEDFPGVTPSALPAGGDAGISSTLRLAEHFRDQFSPKQQARLDDLLEPGRHSATITADGTITPSDGSGVSGLMAGPLTEQDKRYRDLNAEVLKDLSAHFPGLPTFPEIELFFTNLNLSGMDARLTTETFPGQPAKTVCAIRIHPSFVANSPSDDKIRFFFAHELFHCGQDLMDTPPDAPKWLVEGSADWAATDLYRDRTLDFCCMWLNWFTSPHRALKSRAYGAWPLYESYRLYEGLDPFDSIRDMLVVDSKDPAVLLGAGTMDGLLFRKEWSSRTLRSSVLDYPWVMAWPTPSPQDGPHDNVYALLDGPVGKFDVKGHAEFTHRQLVVNMASDVGLVTAKPKGGPLTTHTAGGTVTVGADETGRFCFSPDGCRCPDGLDSGAHGMASRLMLFSYPAAVQAATTAVVATEWDPDKECRREPRPKDAWSNGDPHLVTFDGIPYDVMTLGEFVTARDPAGGFEVQARHEAFRSGAGTSAVAFDTGEGRVTVTMEDFFSSDDPVIKVDGAITSQPAFEVGGVAFTTDGLGVEAIWPDGSRIEMTWFMGWFVSFEVAAERAARLEGLLGSGDDDLTNDLRFPNGTTVDTSDAEPHESPFVLAWSVDDASTLFDYLPGQSTATFRIPHPNPNPPPPDPEAEAACESALGEDAASHEVASCAFDVTVTGEDEFIGAYQVVVEERTTGTDLPPIAIPSTTTSTGPVAGGQAGQPALILDDASPSGAVAAVEGTVMVVVVETCPDYNVRVTVTPVGSDDELAVATLCDPSGLAGLLADDDDEWVNGEAYIWLPGSGDYQVTLDWLDFGSIPGEFAVYIDPTPTVLRADQLTGGDETVLSGIADTVVYLTDPLAVYTAEGFDSACAVEVYWTDEFPRSEPWDLDFCTHSSGIDFPGDSVFPVVVFSRRGDEMTVRLTPAD